MAQSQAYAYTGGQRKYDKGNKKNPGIVAEPAFDVFLCGSGCGGSKC